MGVKASVVERLCRQGDESAFSCIQSQGELSTLKEANVPVLLSLHREGISSYAVLYKLSNDAAQLLVAGQRVELPLDKLETLWNGNIIKYGKTIGARLLNPICRDLQSMN